MEQNYWLSSLVLVLYFRPLIFFWHKIVYFGTLSSSLTSVLSSSASEIANSLFATVNWTGGVMTLSSELLWSAREEEWTWNQTSSLYPPTKIRTENWFLSWLRSSMIRASDRQLNDPGSIPAGFFSVRSSGQFLSLSEKKGRSSIWWYCPDRSKLSIWRVNLVTCELVTRY